jgi:hypothetical protein
MKARTIRNADMTENNNRSGHADERAAPTSDALNITKVEPTSHQLVLTDSTANGMVA